MTQEVIVPWWAASLPARKRVLYFVTAHLRNHGLEPLLYTASPWSPGAARNRGVRMTSGDVLLFNDADTIVEYAQIEQALALAREAPGLVYAYTLYQRRTEGGRVERELYMPPSLGCVAISRASFLELGGFDENFRGWGYEDVEFAQRAGRRWPLRRVDGLADHLWHGERNRDDSPTDADPTLVRANLDLYRSLLEQAS